LSAPKWEKNLQSEEAPCARVAQASGYRTLFFMVIYVVSCLRMSASVS